MRLVCPLTFLRLPHNLIKVKLVDLIECAFNMEGALYLAYSDKKAIFTSSDQMRYNLWSCQNVCGALSYLWDNIYNKNWYLFIQTNRWRSDVYKLCC